MSVNDLGSAHGADGTQNDRAVTNPAGMAESLARISALTTQNFKNPFQIQVKKRKGACCSSPKPVSQIFSDGTAHWACLNCHAHGDEPTALFLETLGPCTWTADDEMATEHEVQTFLHALVRLVKPETIFETGTYKGRATAAMAAALDMNNLGVIFTCDTDGARLNEAAAHLHDLALAHRVIWLKKTGVAAIDVITSIDFAFLDSGGDRMEEARAILPKLTKGAYVAIHDTSRPNEQEAVEWLQQQAHTEELTFDTPRGFTVLRIWA